MAKKQNLSIEEVRHVAKLANLDLSEEELKRLDGDLSQTIKFVDHLSEIATNGVEPTAQVTGKSNELRADEVKPGLSQAEALSNGAKIHNGYFVSSVKWN